MRRGRRQAGAEEGLHAIGEAYGTSSRLFFGTVLYLGRARCRGSLPPPERTRRNLPAVRSRRLFRETFVDLRLERVFGRSKESGRELEPLFFLGRAMLR